jgi:hypothetical protein
MNYRKITISLVIAVMISLVTFGKVFATDDPVLIGSWVSFRTNDDNKDDDTQVNIQVFDKYGNLAAETDNSWGEFKDGSNNGPYNLEVVNNAATKTDLIGGKLSESRQQKTFGITGRLR